jgi:hypothetical protein
LELFIHLPHLELGLLQLASLPLMISLLLVVEEVELLAEAVVLVDTEQGLDLQLHLETLIPLLSDLVVQDHQIVLVQLIHKHPMDLVQFLIQ